MTELVTDSKLQQKVAKPSKSLTCTTLQAGTCQGHSSLDTPSELNPPQRIPSPLFVALLVPQAEG